MRVLDTQSRLLFKPQFDLQIIQIGRAHLALGLHVSNLVAALLDGTALRPRPLQADVKVGVDRVEKG